MPASTATYVQACKLSAWTMNFLVCDIMICHIALLSRSITWDLRWIDSWFFRDCCHDRQPTYGRLNVRKNNKHATSKQLQNGKGSFSLPKIEYLSISLSLTVLPRLQRLFSFLFWRGSEKARTFWLEKNVPHQMEAWYFV